MHANTEVRSYEVLPDGTEIVIRPVHPEDRKLLAAGFALLGADSRYQRFFAPKLELSEEELTTFTVMDGHQNNAIGMVAWDEEGHERPVGIARYVRDAPDSTTAEAAITIVDSMQGKGIGKLLLKKLAEAAYDDGIRHFRARVLTDNVAALRLMRWLDPKLRVLGFEPGVEEVELVLPPPSILKTMNLAPRRARRDAG